MLEPKIKKQIDSLWKKFYSNGMANTLEIVEQMSYLIFFRKLEVTDGVNETRAKVQGKNYKSIYKNFK